MVKKMNVAFRKHFLALTAVFLFGMVFLSSPSASAQVDAATLAKAMQSIVVITVETEKGSTVTGLGFLTAGENRAVTALHLLKNAKKVMARFQNGEEVLSPGLVDSDEKRGIAILDLPVPGKTALILAPAKVMPGTAVNCGAVRDGAYGFVQLSVTEVHQGTDGIERYILSGEASFGNSGAPALDAKGNVTGLVLETKTGRILVPSSFIMALNPSLLSKAWGTQIEPATLAQLAAPASGPMDEIDSSILDFLILRANHQVVCYWADEVTKGKGFLQGVPQDLYNYQTKLEVGLRRIREIKTKDPSRTTLLKNLREIGASQYVAAENLAKAIVTGQQTNNWGPQAQDLQKRSKAAFTMAQDLLASQNSILHEIHSRSAAWKSKMPKDLVYELAIEPRPSLFRLGVQTLATNPFYLSIVYSGTFASTLGLLPGDRILAAGGNKLGPDGSIEEFKMIVQDNLGNTIPVTVERNGKKTDLKMDVPKEIPVNFLY